MQTKERRVQGLGHATGPVFRSSDAFSIGINSSHPIPPPIGKFVAKGKDDWQRAWTALDERCSACLIPMDDRINKYTRERRPPPEVGPDKESPTYMLCP